MILNLGTVGFRDWSLITGKEGGGATKREGGACTCEVLPL